MASAPKADGENYTRSESDAQVIVDLLQDFKPEPSTRFHKRMGKAPWRKYAHHPAGGISSNIRMLIATAVVAVVAITATTLSARVASPITGITQRNVTTLSHTNAPTESYQAQMISDSRAPLVIGWLQPSDPLPMDSGLSGNGVITYISRDPYLADEPDIQIMYLEDGQVVFVSTVSTSRRNQTSPNQHAKQQDTASTANRHERDDWSLHEIQVAVAAGGKVPGLIVVGDPNTAIQALRYLGGTIMYD